MPEPNATHQSRTRLPDGTTTLAMVWVINTLYGFFAALASPTRVSLTGWTAVFVVLIVAWSVMERKRWGRLALLGMAALTMLDALWAGHHVLTTTQPAALTEVNGTLFPLSSFRASGGLLFVGGLLLLAAGTVAWLQRSVVRAEFETRKRTETRRFQAGIAFLLVCLWSLGAMTFGPARLAASIRPSREIRPVPRHPAGRTAAAGALLTQPALHRLDLM